MGEPSAIPRGALEDIAYLSRSENRVKILEALAAGAYPRRELEAVTGTSRTTLGRILSEFEERGWAERTPDGEYVATPRGSLVVTEFTPLVETMDTIRTLGDATACLPADELSIDIRHFRDATVRRTDPNSPLQYVDHLATLIRDGTRFRVITYMAPPSAVGEAMYEGVVDGRLTAEHVLAGGLVGYLRDRQPSPPVWPEYIDAGAQVYRYDGHIPCNLFVVDQTVIIMKDRPEGGGTAVESADETVRAGVDELFETYREAAELVDAEQFA